MKYIQLAGGLVFILFGIVSLIKAFSRIYLICVMSVQYVKLKNLESREEKVIGGLNGNTV